METLESLRSITGAFKPVHVKPTEIRKVGSRLYYGESPLNHRAFTDLCNIFKLQYSSLNSESEDLDEKKPNRWPDLSKALANFREEKVLTGVIDPSLGQVIKIFRGVVDDISFSWQMKMVESYLNVATKTMDILPPRFDNDKYQVVLPLMGRETSVKVGSGDEWKYGLSLNIGLEDLRVNHALLRLICTNGMVATQTIGSVKFDEDMDHSLFVKKVESSKVGVLDNKIKVSVKRMKDTNASLAEVVRARRAFGVENEDFRVDLAGIREAYRDEKVLTRPTKWLERANSGINCYDFFNYLTASASHSKDLKDYSKNALNIQASDLFFKGPDLAWIPDNPFGQKSGRIHTV